jgi:hypothetical protein
LTAAHTLPIRLEKTRARALAATFRSENVGLILVGSYQKPVSFGPGTTNVVEHYPVLDET